MSVADNTAPIGAGSVCMWDKMVFNVPPPPLPVPLLSSSR